MGKVLTYAAIAVGVAALVLTGVGVIIGPVAMAGVTAALGGITAAMLSAAAAVLSIGASLLSPRPKPPGISQATLDRLNMSLNPRTPRKAVFGQTCFAADLRDAEVNPISGKKNEFWADRFIVLAAHKIQSVDQIWLDDEKVWQSGIITGKAAKGFLTVDVRLEGNLSNAINIGSRLGGHRTFTGCGYIHLRFKINDKSPYTQSIPTRITTIGRGMPVYDPRKDSTVGGSGSQRADNQATWSYDTTGYANPQGENPALQMLAWLLGWKIQNPATLEWKLSVGRGLPKDRFNMASFMVAANMCEEIVATKTSVERRYKTAAIVAEDEDPLTVVDRWKAAMNAVMDDMDGQISLRVLVNDLGAPVASFNESHVLNEFQWKPFENLTSGYNQVRGQFVSPTDQALFQLIDYPDVVVASRDGIDRPEYVTFDMVQSPSQAQRLAKQRLQRAQYPGIFQAEFQAGAWKVQKGDVVDFTFGPCGFLNKLFRVIELEHRVDGKVPMTFREEHPSIYAWDTTEEGDVSLADPLNWSLLDSPWYLIMTGQWISAAFYGPDGNMMVDAQFGSLWPNIDELWRQPGTETAEFPFPSQMAYLLELPLGLSTDISVASSERIPVVPGRLYWQRLRVAKELATSGVATLELRSQFYDKTDTALAPPFSATITLADLASDGSYYDWLINTIAPVNALYLKFEFGIPPNTAVGSIRIAEPWFSDKQPGADVTLSLGFGPTEVSIEYASDGSVVPGQVPVDLAYRVYSMGVEVGSNLGGTWRIIEGGINTLTPLSGSQPFTVSAPDLLLTLTSVEQDSQLSLEATASGRLVPPLTVNVKRATTLPPSGGGAAGAPFDYWGPWSNITGTTFVDIGGGLHTVVVGAGQTKVQVSFHTSYRHIVKNVAKTSHVTVKVQRETSPGSYVDVGPPQTAIASTYLSSGNWRQTNAIGLLTYLETLSPGTYKYRLVGAIASGETGVEYAPIAQAWFNGYPTT